MRTDFDIVGSFNDQRVAGFDAERTINMFEYDDPLGKKNKALLPTAGLLNRLNVVTSGSFRAQFVFKNVLYNVIGTGVYRVTDLLVSTLIGTLGTASGYVGIDANTFQIIFVDGLNGWIWDTNASTFTMITDVNFPSQPIDVAQLGGYFFVAQGNSAEFRASQLNQGTVYTPLSSGSITTHPGNIVALRTLHKKLFIFSDNFTEIWQLVANAALPVAPNQSLLMEVGAISSASIVTGFDMMFFLSRDVNGLGSVVMVTGSQAIPVSPNSLDYFIQKFDVVSDASGILYRENGIIFYRLNFTAADYTFVYNATMSTPESRKWHEEEMLGGGRHVAQTHAYFINTNFFGSYLNSIMYEVNDTFTTNDGELIRRERIPKMVAPPAYQRIRCNRFQLDLLQGQVEDDGTNVAPQVFLSLSKDGGQTYGNEIMAPMGKLGERTYRTVWRKLGTTKRGQAFLPRIQFFSKIPFVILGCAWDYEVLPE